MNVSLDNTSHTLMVESGRMNCMYKSTVYLTAELGRPSIIRRNMADANGWTTGKESNTR